MRTARLRATGIEPSVVVAPLGAIVGILVPLAVVQEAWKSLFGLMLLCVTPIVLRWPVLTTLGAYVLLMPFEQVLRVPGAGSAHRLLGLLAIAGLLAAGLVHGRLTRPPIAALWFGLFVLWTMASTIWAIDEVLAFSRVPTALSLFLLYLVAASFRVSKKEFEMICVLAVVGGVVAGVFSWFYTPDEGVYGTQRQTMMTDDAITDANAFASSLLLPLVLATAGLIRFRGVATRTAAVAAIGLLSTTILLTLSRGSLLAVMVMFAVMAVRMRARWPVVASIGAVAVVVPFMPDKFFDRITGLFDGTDPTGAGRTRIWEVGLDILQDHFGLGVGFLNFPVAYDLYASAGPRSKVVAPHSLYLGVAAEVGVLGLTLLLACLATHLWRARQSRDPAFGREVLVAAIQAACVANLVASLFLDTLLKKWFWLPWMLSTWAVATYTSSASLAPSPSRARGDENVATLERHVDRTEL
jgi:O-antigen ligase